VTLPRPGVELGRLAELRRALGEATVERILTDVSHTPLVDISSTEIRRRVKADLPIDELVPAAVAEYIRAHRLYR
jgi:nicotinate-nucleotide adenylyltransferase